MTTLSKSLGVVRGTGLMLNIVVGSGMLALALTAGLLIAEGPAPAYPLALAMAGWAFLRWRRFSADRARGPG